MAAERGKRLRSRGKHRTPLPLLLGSVAALTVLTTAVLHRWTAGTAVDPEQFLPSARHEPPPTDAAPGPSDRRRQHGQSRGCERADRFPWSERPGFVLGILSDGSSEGRHWQRLLKQTWLRNAPAFPADRQREQASVYEKHRPLVCPLWNDAASSTPRTGARPSTDRSQYMACRVLYTFVVPAMNQVNRTSFDRILNSDTVALTATHDLPLEIAWFQYAARKERTNLRPNYTRHSTDRYIAVMDQQLLLHPALFLDYIDSLHFQRRRMQPSQAETHYDWYGSTPFVRRLDCFLNLSFWRGHEDDCSRTTGRMLFGSLERVRHALGCWQRSGETASHPEQLTRRYEPKKAVVLPMDVVEHNLIRFREMMGMANAAKSTTFDPSIRPYRDQNSRSYVLLPRIVKLNTLEETVPRWDAMLSSTRTMSNPVNRQPPHRHVLRVSAAANTTAHMAGDSVPDVHPGQPTYEQLRSELRSMHPDLSCRIIYVTGKFGRTVNRFHDEVLGGRQRVVKQQLSSYLSDGNAANEPLIYDTSTQVWSYDSQFPDFILNDGRWQKRHLQFLWNSSVSSRGAGYWFFKAPLIENAVRYAMAEMAGNSADHGGKHDDVFIVYADIDQDWDNDIVRTIMHRMSTTASNLAMKHGRHLERRYTKGDTYRRICGNHTSIDDDDSLQYRGGWMMLRIDVGVGDNDGLLRFLQTWTGWIALLDEYEVLLTDAEGEHNSAEFVEHRHDQSVISLLLKCYGTTMTRNVPTDVLELPGDYGRLHLFSF